IVPKFAGTAVAVMQRDGALSVSFARLRLHRTTPIFVDILLLRPARGVQGRVGGGSCSSADTARGGGPAVCTYRLLLHARPSPPAGGGATRYDNSEEVPNR